MSKKSNQKTPIRNNNIVVRTSQGYSRQAPRRRSRSNQRRRFISVTIITLLLVAIIVGAVYGIMALVNRHQASEAAEQQAANTSQQETANTTPEPTVTFTVDDDYKATHTYCVTVNTAQNIVIVYGKDDAGEYTQPVKAFVCSCGIPGEGENDSSTTLGSFYTTDQYEWRLLTGNVYGQYATRITGHILFHSVPYFTQDKSDLEYEEFNKLGENASAGCVRMTVEDAKWIYDNLEVGTNVVIYDDATITEPLEKPTAPTIDVNSENRGWDPTDPDPENPWNA